MADQPVHRDCLRNRIERFFNKLQQFRRIATRYDKFAANYLPMIEIATMLMSPRPRLPPWKAKACG